MLESFYYCEVILPELEKIIAIAYHVSETITFKNKEKVIDLFRHHRQREPRSATTALIPLYLVENFALGIQNILKDI